jgi:hypothetical protein
MKPPGPCSAGSFFPQFRWAQVAPQAVQQALTDLFARWGKPQRIRVDNGLPWGNPSDLPPALALWWVGLGIAPIWNHPHCPKENAKVERCNGLLEPWGEPAQCADAAAWEKQVAWVVQTQRERYPSVHGQSRLAAYPELAAPRPAPADGSLAGFDLARVTAYLAQGRWRRRVSKVGQITFYGQGYRVGRPWGGEHVWVRLDAASHEWVVSQEDGTELRRYPAAQISTERICALQVSCPHSSAKYRKRHNSPAEAVTQPYSG